MCGRYTLKTPVKEMAEALALDEFPSLLPRYNIVPTQTVAVVRVLPESQKRRLDLLRWGLIPSWVKDPKTLGSDLINAKSETMAEKPSFRAAFRRRRCLIPADGFYEWKKEGGRKQPVYICMKDRGPFAFAGLWERWESEEKQAIESCTLLTTEPNEMMQPIHNRMPVILGRKDYDLWLDPDVQQPDKLRPLLRPFPSEPMTCYAVNLRVNNPQYDDPLCLEPLPFDAHRTSLF